jgi:hypothetical protein
VLLFLIFLIGLLENGRCEGKKGRVIKKKKKKKKKKKIGVEYLKKKKNEIVEF